MSEALSSVACQLQSLDPWPSSLCMQHDQGCNSRMQCTTNAGSWSKASWQVAGVQCSCAIGTVRAIVIGWRLEKAASTPKQSTHGAAADSWQWLGQRWECAAGASRYFGAADHRTDTVISDTAGPPSAPSCSVSGADDFTCREFPGMWLMSRRVGAVGVR